MDQSDNNIQEGDYIGETFIKKFNILSILIGILIGILIMLIIFWLSYSTRSFIFNYCPINPQKCHRNDYINDPSIALEEGYKTEDILFLNNENQLVYNRVIASSNCTPESNRSIIIKKPLYCLLKKEEEESIFKREGNSNSETYYNIDNKDEIINLGNHCMNSDYDEYKPLVIWN